MTERTHEELRSLVAAYVLGSVPPEEVGVVRAHILTCDECMGEADGYSAAIDSLALAVEPAPVPDGFADRVLAQITPSVETQTARDTQVVQDGSQTARPRWWKRAPLLAGGMAMLALIGVLAAGLIQTRANLDRSEQVLSAVLHAEGIELKGASGAAGELVPTNGSAVFAVAGLPEAPGSHVYQLWYMRDGEPVSVGTFETRDSVLVMELDEPFDGYDAVAVTIEPEGGSRLPTSDPVISSL